MTHEVKIRFNNDTAVLTIDGRTINIDEDVAVIIANAISTYLNEWFAPEGDTIFVAPMSSMKIKMKKTKDEIEFTIE